MALVPAGEFIMGSNKVDKEHKAEAFGIPKPWFEDENPERRVYLAAFYIDKYEVTNEQYKKFIDTTGYSPPPDWKDGMYMSETANHPVTNINFNDAVAYAVWAGKKIPAEEEWEKSARGMDGRLYPWGNIFDVSMANLSKAMTNVSKKMPVGLFKNGISPYGAYDMIGNVWEWTSSRYKPYEGNKKSGVNYDEDNMVIRGLSYSYIGHFPGDVYKEALSYMARISYRQDIFPTAKSPDLGFRCIKYVDEA